MRKVYTSRILAASADVISEAQRDLPCGTQAFLRCFLPRRVMSLLTRPLGGGAEGLPIRAKVCSIKALASVHKIIYYSVVVAHSQY